MGLTASAGAIGIWALWSEVTYLHPYWQVVMADHGLYVGAYGATALSTLATGIYALARVLGLGAVGRKVDVVEREIRRGQGQEEELATALARDSAGDYS